MKEYIDADVYIPSLRAAKHPARNRRPSAIAELAKVLEPNSFPFSLEKGMILDFRREINYIFLLKEGRMSMVRGDNNIYVKVNIEKTLLGLANAIHENQGHYFIAETHCELSYIPITVAKAMFTEKKLWQSVCEVVTYSMVSLWKENCKLVGKGAYEQIKEVILDICSQPEEIRKNIKVAAYIQKRTSISRTSVMRILRALKFGQYIEIGINGKGVFIHKELPEKF
jgi:hypothetical protein